MDPNDALQDRLPWGRRWTPWVLVALSVSRFAGRAEANGRFPAVVSAHFQPGEGAQLIIGATFGGVLSQDGRTFDWICEGAIGYGGFFDPDFALSADGVLFASTFSGLARSADGGCSWGYAYGDILGYWVDGFALHPSDPSVVVAGTSSGGRLNALMRSTDGGRSFTIVPGTASPTQFFKSLVFAPSDGTRVYATSYIATPASNTLWSSRDGGISFQTQPFALGGAAEFKLLAVHPANPDIVFARTVAAGPGQQPYLVVRSDDAGAHWAEVLETPELVTTLSLSPDGQTAVVAATTGMFRSTDGGASFPEHDAMPRVACTAVHGGLLYGCGDDASDGFALGRSTGFGASWSGLFRPRDLRGVVRCPAGARATWLPASDSASQLMQSRNTQELCGPYWPGTAAQLGVTGAPDAGLVDGADGAAADAAAPPAMGGDGVCGCRAGGQRRGLQTWMGLALVVIAVRVARRRLAK